MPISFWIELFNTDAHVKSADTDFEKNTVKNDLEKDFNYNFEILRYVIAILNSSMSIKLKFLNYETYIIINSNVTCIKL